MDENKINIEQELYLAPDTEEISEMLIEKNSQNVEEIPLVLETAVSKKMRLDEIRELRETKRKVFRMSDGTEQAVFSPTDLHVFDDETQTYQEVDTTLYEDGDGKHYISGKNRFLAKFSREEDNDELFSVESGIHRVTVSAKKNKKNKNKGVRPNVLRKSIEGVNDTDIINFPNVESGADFEYRIEGNGVKEEIVIKEKAEIYHFPFVMHCENVTARFDADNKRVAFFSNETGDEVFYIPAPFMTDANGMTSDEVSYVFRKINNGNIHFSVNADSQWINSKERVLPVVIDPQINLSGGSNMTIYSWDNGYMHSAAYHKIGMVGCVAQSYSVNAACDNDVSSSMSNATLLSLNSWMNGTICCPGDQVWYKFTTEGSGSYTIRTQGSMDSMGYLYDANGCLITSNDDCNGNNFCITANLSANTIYYLMVRAWSSNTGNYSVAVVHQSSSGSSGGSSGSSGGSSSSTQDGSDMYNAIPLSIDNWKSGSINYPNDEVWYTFTATAGSGTYVIGTKGNMDTKGYLYDSNGCFITSNDDNGGLNFKINFYLTGGNTYYLKVRDYSTKTGNYTVGVSTECFDGGSEPVVCYSPQRIYMNFNMPSLPRNPRIKKAELKFYQKDGRADCATNAKIGLYQVNGSINSGYCNPSYNSNLIDFAEIKTETFSEGLRTSYSFDITTLMGTINKGESYSPRLMLKLLDESVSYENFIELYGSTSGNLAPQIVVTYESSYGVNTSYRTHTHELGRFGQGSIDLQCGNLMFESEDFAWGGNRMPVTIKHIYNSALANYQYTSNSSIGLNTANFSGMKLGKGFKLNIMQSMVMNSNGEYVYIGANGEETYFKKSNDTICYDNCQCEYLYKDTESGEMVYNPVECTMTQGDDVYKFANGRLISITQDKNTQEKNTLKINYNSYGQIESVIDGAGRYFEFDYSNKFLMSIKAPDGTLIKFNYQGEFLSTVTYPDGRRASISYSFYKPATVILRDKTGKMVYKVCYSFSGNRLYSVKEYGADGLEGSKTVYSYSAASGRTIVQTYELMDGAECEDCYETSVKTVYTFDDDGNIVSEYVYSEDTGNVGAEGEESGINPHSGDGGAGVVSNINNLLRDHSFVNLDNWHVMPCNCGDLYYNNYASQTDAKFGTKVLSMSSNASYCTENGIYQDTNILPAGEYTFSSYVRVSHFSSGPKNKGAYIRVTTTDGTVLAESEHIFEVDSEFIRLIAPFVLETAQSVKVQLLLSGKGTAYFDAPQLENNPYANAYNMLENGNFELSTGWTRNGAYYTTGTRFNMNRSMYITGNVEYHRYAYQKVYVKPDRTSRETFTLSGWAKGYGLPVHENGVKSTFRLRARIKYNDERYNDRSFEEYTADFSPCTEEWQLASVEFAKSKYRTVEYIEIFLDYDYNYGVAYFDDIQLVRNSIETNLSAEDFETEPEEKITETGTGEEESKNNEDTGFKELTDKYGNTLTETTFTDGEFGTIYRAFKFNADTNDISGDDAGNDLISETDARGNVTEYIVDGDTSRNEEVIDRCGNKTAYEYDQSGRTTKVTSLKPKRDVDENVITDKNGNILYEEIANVSYTYDSFDNLTQIVRGDGMKYVLKYNAFHNLESIGIEGKTDGDLIKYNYKDGNGRLKEMTYANGDKMTATYNGVGQMVAEKWYNSLNKLTAHYKYVYDGQGNIVRSIDILSKKAYNYLYEDGKIIQSSESDIELDVNNIIISKTFVCTVRYYYDAEDNLVKKRTKFADGNEHTVTYEQAENDAQIVRFTAGGKIVTSHSKTDSFGRKVFDELQLGAGFISRQFHYHEGEVTDEHAQNDMLKSTPTTQLVSQIVLSGGRTISYEYDAEERITKVTDSIDGITEYTYDALGQLLTETKNGETVNQMFYDSYGNILHKNGIQYVYDEVWEDKLISYNGQPITYDAQGNPTEYLGHNLTWEKGRQLKSFDNIQYTYNANGIRTSKTIAGNKHTYILDGTKILKEVWDNGDEILEMLYDNEDNICGIIYNETPYFFQKNLQGDIIAITDNTGKEVARYSYDAWGACTVVKDTTSPSIATINPFRYRSYYFDKEIGMYYLQSRYYNPIVGRFVNGDSIEWLGTNERIVETNIFAYCKNDCVNLSDEVGFGGINTLLSVLGTSIDILAKIIDMIGNSYNKERKALEKSVKLLTKKQSRNLSNIKALQKETSKLSKRLGWIGYGITFFVLVVGFAASYSTGHNLATSLIELGIETFIALIEIGAGKVFEWIARFIPYVGFLIGLIAGWLISYLLSKFFNSRRVARITLKFKSSVKNIKISLGNWIKYAVKSLNA